MTPRIARSVIASTAQLHGISWLQLMGESRRPEIVACRWDCIQRLHNGGMGYSAIGRVLGIHHTTVLHAVREMRRIDELSERRAMRAGGAQ